MNNKIFWILISLLIYLFADSCSGAMGTTYFVSLEGDDSYAGTSENKAWKTIEKVNMHQFSSGDKILFRGGDTFEGTIRFTSEDSGTELWKVEVSAFGNGRAVINGNEFEALLLDSCAYLTIENLTLCGIGRKNGNTRDGLLALNCNGIIVNELEAFGFQKSGVHLRQCDDATITHVYAHNNGFSGIHVTGVGGSDPGKYCNRNLYIAYCVAENNPGDPTVLKNHSGNGILASSVKGGIIEYCEAFNNGWDMPWTGNGPVGIWIWDCTDMIIQYCISHHNRTNPVAADGGGFDFDGGVSNSVIQYCISHNNEGAGFGLYEFGASAPWENNTVRYNISQDDGIINGASVGIWKNDKRGVMRNCQIYNNIFYNSQTGGANIWLYDHYPGFTFRNNVFVYNGAIIGEGKSPEDEVFQGNLYWNLTGDGSFFGFGDLREWAEATGKEMINDKIAGTFQDPLFLDPGSLEVTNPMKINAESLKAYFPQPGSPLIDKGLDLMQLFNMDPGARDLVGTSIPNNGIYDLGAIESRKE